MVKSKIILLNIILMIILVVISILFVNDTNEYNHELYNYLFCLFGTLIYIWCIWSWYKIRKEVLCPYIIFISTAFTFMFGQSILTALGIPIDIKRDLHLRYSAFTMLKANIFTCMGLYAFHNGAIISLRGNKAINKHWYNIDETNLKERYIYRGTQITGWLLFLMSVIPTIIQMLNSIRLVANYGYGILYDDSLIEVGIQKWDSILQQFFVPSLICLFVSSYKNKFVRRFSVICMIIYIAAVFYLGGRSKGVVLALCLFCMWHYLVKPIKGLKALLSIVCGVVFISFMPIIFRLRSLSGRSFFDYLKLFFESIGKDNLFVETISEMGGSMFPLINVILLIPEAFNFRYGESYLYSFFTIIPNIGFWDLHPSAIKANLGNWLQNALGLNYGPGFSMAAEAYINFGWFGILFMFIIGYFFGRVFGLIHRKEDTRQYNPAILSFVFSVLTLTLTTVRNSFIGTVRAFLFFSFPMYILCRIFAGYLEYYGRMNMISINKEYRK